MNRFIDITGKRFGHWTVLAAHPVRIRHVRWLCRCDCGVNRKVRGDTLRRGISTSCGCACVKHGMSKTRAYVIWINLKQRCFNPQNPRYLHYGARGITVCERWLVFENFYADMGDPPPGLSIDRINNDANYEPGNCRWATHAVQRSNQRPPKKGHKKRRRRATVEHLRAYTDALARAGTRLTPAAVAS